MAYKIGRFIFPNWENIDVFEGHFIDTFIFDLSSGDRLPPGAYCDLILKAAFEIAKFRPTGSVWVRVDSPGLWFPLEIRRGLHRSRVPVAVTRKDARLILADFNRMPYLGRQRLGCPPYALVWGSPVSSDELDCLRVLARIKTGLTTEIASLAALDFESARSSLEFLQQRRLVTLAWPQLPNGPEAALMSGKHARMRAKLIDERSIPDKPTQALRRYSEGYRHWQLRADGLKIARRSWGVPPRSRFNARLEADHGEAGRHRLTARLWLDWLKSDLGENGRVWESWTEATLPGVRRTPDALAWGSLEGGEVLFWLEVESGHSSTTHLLDKIRKCFLFAQSYATERRVNLVFAVLGPPWVGAAVKFAFADMSARVAVVIQDWKAFGELPVIQWGRVRTTLN